MSQHSNQPRSFGFGPFELDLEEAELRRDGKAVTLAPQPTRVLTALLGHAGHVVTRDELRQQVWGDSTFVDFEHGLNSCIRQIRAALGDDGEAERYIQTVPRRGYRFVAPVVERHSPAVHPSQALRNNSLLHSPRPRLALVLLSVGLLLFVWFYVIPTKKNSVSSDRTAKVQLAVLPFENLTGDPEQEFFSDGLTEETIAQLGNLQPERLSVIARTSSMKYKHTSLGVAEIGRQLRVQYVIEGSVRRDGDRVRITAHLIRVSDQTHLWSEDFDREMAGVLSVQTDVARSVAREIHLQLTPEQQARVVSLQGRNSTAYESYLKGRYYWNKRSFEGAHRALAYFQEAVEKDPDYAPAYVGLCDTYIVEPTAYLAMPEKDAYEKARRAIQRALEIDDRAAGGHAALASILFEGDWDWAGAEVEFRRAIALDPGDASAHMWFSQFLSVAGRHQEAIAEANRARELDPLSLIANVNLGMRYYFARQYDQAVEKLHFALELDPNMLTAYEQIARVYEEEGMYDEVVSMYKSQLALNDAGENEITALEDAYAAQGRQGFYQWRLQYLQNVASKYPVEPMIFAQHFAAAGNKRQALAWLERAYKSHANWLPYFKVDPVYDNLRHAPRYEAILRELGLPQ